MNQLEFYKSVADCFPDKFKAMIKNRDAECCGCPNYVKDTVDGYPVRGCQKGINLNWLIENECDERQSLQTTIFDMESK
jgi:hypothetical protein